MEALLRIEQGGYANLVVPSLLSDSGLSERDRAFATELAYGTTRMRRACDHLLDPHLRRDLDDEVRGALRVGAYQLAFLGTPPHAAVAETVAVAPRRARGLVNAVLRRVAASLPPRWPDPPTRLSYPDWVVRHLATELGATAAERALETMNEPPPVTRRPDGYVQDLASQWVGELIGAGPGDRVADLCAGPGGKATLVAAGGPRLVAAADLRPHRAGLVAGAARRLRAGNVAVVVADALAPPFRTGAFDRVLVDAPCSGLGVLRRRPDARWRIEEGDVERLAALQRGLVEHASGLLRPGGVLVYSVCTLTVAETTAIDDHLAAARPELRALPPPGLPWSPLGRGARLLPQDAGTDGMYVLRVTK